MKKWLRKRKGARNGTVLDDAAILDAAVRRGIAFMTDGALISLIADRHAEEPAVVEAAIREREDRNPKKPRRTVLPKRIEQWLGDMRAGVGPGNRIRRCE